jgi:uroporphyrinogen-III synthase
LKDEKPLTGCSVLVTRPQHQAAAFQQLLKEQGAEVYLFPTLDIIPLPLLTAQQRSFLTAADILIFTSPNAVSFSKTLLTSCDFVTSSIAAIGKKTALSLAKINIMTNILPLPPFNSEALLKHPKLQTITNKTITIVKGKGGLNVLAKELTSRGANVIELAVYRRKCPTPTQQRLHELSQKKIDIITLTSSESAYNLFTLLNGQNWLPNTPLLVGSSRIQKELIKQGIHNSLFVANNPSDKKMLQTLLEWNNK